MPPRLRLLALVVAAALAMASCTTDGTAANPTEPATTPAEACPEPARPVPVADDGTALLDPIDGPDPVAESIAVSEAAYQCASSVVIVADTDLSVTALAARLAAGIGAPLLFATAGARPDLDAELARLAPRRVVIVGDGATVTAPEGAATERLAGDTARIADLVRRLVPARTAVRLPDHDPVATVITTLRAIDGRLTLVPDGAVSATTAPDEAGGPTSEPDPTGTTGTSSVTTTTSSPTTTAPVSVMPVLTDARDPELPIMIGGPGRTGSVWLVDADRPDLALVAMVAATVADGMVSFVNGDDLRSATEASRAIRRSRGGARTVHLLGDITEHAEWQVPVLLEAEELPGGGYLMFPGRRLVALYGNPLTTDLGVLGERDAEGGLAYLRPIAAQYAEDGYTIIPAFEIIATVAAGDAGADGDYSRETALDVIRPWIEIAAQRGAYVLLDLQSGRSDSLSQAMIYEEFLRLPHVGLALDPEWRLEPDEVHLQQIGSMSAAEINEVIAWLAEIVREEALPQKMLLLHQFRFSMLPDRELIEPSPELALVIQMDGQGRIEDKYATWNALTGGWPDHPWLWGWKNFYDEDFPTPTPDQVLELSPAVVYVSYQ